MENWFTIDRLDSGTHIISEYRHWEETHCYLLNGVIDNLKAKGAHGVILGCTEIGLLIHQTDSSLPVFDTTVIHAKQAVELALEV